MTTPPALVSPLAALRSSAGQVVRPTADDVLWLARAVEAEGAPHELVAQTLVNRYLWLLDHGGLYPTLAALVRAYAQPINPRWFAGGDLHAAARERSAPEGRAALDEKAARRERLHAARTVFSPTTIAAVRQALHGPVTIPPGALHYAIPGRPYPVLVPGGARSNTIYGAGLGPKSAAAIYSVVRQSHPRRGMAALAMAAAIGSAGIIAAKVRG